LPLPLAFDAPIDAGEIPISLAFSAIRHSLEHSACPFRFFGKSHPVLSHHVQATLLRSLQDFSKAENVGSRGGNAQEGDLARAVLEVGAAEDEQGRPAGEVALRRGTGAEDRASGDVFEPDGTGRTSKVGLMEGEPSAGGEVGFGSTNASGLKLEWVKHIDGVRVGPFTMGFDDGDDEGTLESNPEEVTSPSQSLGRPRWVRRCVIDKVFFSVDALNRLREPSAVLAETGVNAPMEDLSSAWREIVGPVLGFPQTRKNMLDAVEQTLVVRERREAGEEVSEQSAAEL